MLGMPTVLGVLIIISLFGLVLTLVLMAYDRRFSVKDIFIATTFACVLAMMVTLLARFK